MIEATLNYPELPGFKDGGTSAEAAVAVADKAWRLREQVKAALTQHGPMTTDECAEKLGEDKLSIRPRFSELRAMGVVEDSGQRRKNTSGRSAAVWRLTGKLRQGDLDL